jgi:hypothetical protein
MKTIINHPHYKRNKRSNSPAQKLNLTTDSRHWGARGIIHIEKIARALKFVRLRLIPEIEAITVRLAILRLVLRHIRVVLFHY